MTPPTSPPRGMRTTSSRSDVATKGRRLQVRLACLLVAMALAPGAALADNKDQAKEHIAKASQAHKAKRYEEARAELQAAYALDPQPDLLYAIGQVEAKLGNCSAATASFQQFAATQTDPQVAKIVEQAIASCKPASGPAATAGAPVQPAPAPAAQASPPSTSTPPAAHKPPAASPAPATTSPGPFAPTPTATASAPSRSPWYHDKLGGALVIGGVVATVVGAVEYRSARSDLDAAEDRSSAANLDRYRDLVDQAHSKRKTSVVFAAAGGALIAAGVVRYVLRRGDTERPGIGAAPAQGGGVVTYEGRF